MMAAESVAQWAGMWVETLVDWKAEHWGGSRADCSAVNWAVCWVNQMADR